MDQNMQQIQQYFSKAQDCYKRGDYNDTLINIRRALESICEVLVANNQLYAFKGMNLFQQIEALKDNQIIERMSVDRYHQLRKLTNEKGAHHGTEATEAEAVEAISKLEAEIKLLFEKYLPKNTVSHSPAVFTPTEQHASHPKRKLKWQYAAAGAIVVLIILIFTVIKNWPASKSSSTAPNETPTSPAAVSSETVASASPSEPDSAATPSVSQSTKPSPQPLIFTFTDQSSTKKFMSKSATVSVTDIEFYPDKTIVTLDIDNKCDSSISIFKTNLWVGNSHQNLGMYDLNISLPAKTDNNTVTIEFENMAYSEGDKINFDVYFFEMPSLTFAYSLK